LEIDLSGSDIKGTSSAAGFDTGGAAVSMKQTDKFDLLDSGRARLGYLVLPSVWLYGTGGLAWTRLDQTTTSVNSDGTTITSMPSWRFGWVAGAGGKPGCGTRTGSPVSNTCTTISAIPATCPRALREPPSS
jgi:outer membrane immunogenic protein